MDNDLIALALKLVELMPVLPPWALTAMRWIAEVSFLLSLAAKAAKRLGLGEPNPATDSKLKQRFYWALHFVDVLAVNTTPIREKDKHRDELERTRAASMPPGPRASIPPGIGMTFMLAFALALASCATTPLQRHAEFADGSAQLIDAAGRALEQRIRQVEEDALDASATRDEAVVSIQRLRTTYAPLEAAYEAVRLAHAAYVDAILRASAAGHERPEPDVLATLSAAWVELLQRARMLGLNLPQPPPALAELLADPGGAP